MKRLVIFLLIVVLALASSCIYERYNADNELLIVSANPMSGGSAKFGDMKVKTIKMAIAEVNNAGGINGKKVKLLVEDDAGSAEKAHQIAEKAAANPKVLAVIGHWNSDCTLAARHVYNGAELPVITDSVNKSITDGTTPYLFRISLSDTYQAKQLAEHIFSKLKAKKNSNSVCKQ